MCVYTMHSCTDSLRRLFCVYVLLQVMYRKILESDLAPPAFMPADAVDICAKLLKRDPKQRLGFNGGDEIKKHPFFKGLDFDQLERKEISAPWHPGVASETDTKHIASEFTNEPAAVRCRLPLPFVQSTQCPALILFVVSPPLCHPGFTITSWLPGPPRCCWWHSAILWWIHV